MTLAKKIAANRTNARKSTGPRTSRGKSKASRNALRHGLATTALREPAVSSRIELMAKIIAGDNAAAAIYEQALIIAESEVIMLNVRAARIAAIERRSTSAPSPRKSTGAVPAELILELEAIASGKLEPPTSPFNLSTGAARHQESDEKYVEANSKIGNPSNPADKEPPGPETISKVAALERAPDDREVAALRDDLEAFRLALPELIKLERYERRALLRRRRAVRTLAELKIFANPIYQSNSKS
jgi:hypothetical protein